MTKQAKESNCGTGLVTTFVSTSTLARLVLAGMATAGCLYLSPAAQAQQAYYLPQAASAPVSINYGALTPYGAPASPAVPGGFQPYGYAAPSSRLSAAPKSVFTPYGQPAYGQVAPAYPVQPVYGYASVPTVTPFVAPYANPAFAPGVRAGLPMSTPASNGYPQSYLNVPGGQKAADAQPTKKKRKKKKSSAAPAPTSTPTATEQGAAAQVAAAEAVLESTPAPAPSTPTQSAASEAVSAAAPAPAAEPVPAPTPPAEPEAVPASVPSPVENAPASAVAAAAPAATEATSAAEATSSTDATSAATSGAEAPADQVASAEAPADTNAGTGAPAGGARIVFDAGSDDLPQGATADLDALADKMAADTNLKVQVLAYSSGTPDAESQARRKALARGLEVRKYLIGKGVRSNRIDVRALGTKSEGGPADRVDIVPSAG
jgi:outer membrane protein OmpA-like peptidoglycan-associated protein